MIPASSVFVAICALSLLSSCSGSNDNEVHSAREGSGTTPLPPRASTSNSTRALHPPNVGSSESFSSAWIEQRIRGALARHGFSEGDEWTSELRETTTGTDGKQIGNAQLITIKKIQIDCEEQELSEADKLNGWKRSVEVTLSAVAYRYGATSASTPTEWLDGSGPLQYLIVQAQQDKDGAVHWGRKHFIAAMTGFTVYRDQDNVLDSVLQNFQSPETDREQLQARYRIIDAMRQDAAASRQAHASRTHSTQVKDVYVPLMEALDLGQCPEPFAAAYRAHIEAWRAADSTSIVSTWDRVEEEARRHGAGTLYLDF